MKIIPLSIRGLIWNMTFKVKNDLNHHSIDTKTTGISKLVNSIKIHEVIYCAEEEEEIRKIHSENSEE